MNTNKGPAEAMLSAIIARLDLEHGTVVFHVLDGRLASGSVLDRERLEVSDAFLAMADDCDSQPTVTASNVTTYMLGTGETYDATTDDIRYLDALKDSDPDTFDTMLDRYADVLASLDDIELENPYFTAEED